MPVASESIDTFGELSRRSMTVCFLGDSYVNGYGDPKHLGWVPRVLSRTSGESLDLTTYNLGIRGDSSAQVMDRWAKETASRWGQVEEKRLVVSCGTNDLKQNISTPRSRLNLANILDDAQATHVAPFVVGPPPTEDNDFNERLRVLVHAQAHVCERRGITYVNCFNPLLDNEQWQADLRTGDGIHPGQAGYGLIAWLVLNAGWDTWITHPQEV